MGTGVHNHGRDGRAENPRHLQMNVGLSHGQRFFRISLKWLSPICYDDGNDDNNSISTASSNRFSTSFNR
jgi:hypothetical protein